MLKSIKYIICLISIIFTLTLMVFMWGFSNDTANTSSSLSLRICVIVIDKYDSLFCNNLLDIDERCEAIEFVHTPIRKCAHMFEYFLLFLAMNLSFSSIYNLEKRNDESLANIFFKLNNKLIFYIVSCCIVYSCIDEIHQFFVKGRACRIADVFIDSIGIAIGLITIILSDKLIYMNIKKQSN